MPKITSARWASFALLGLAFAVTLDAKQARAENSPSARETVLASRNPLPGPSEFRGVHHQIRRERVVRRHFRGPRIIGVDSGAVAVPVPQENEEAYPIEPSVGFGYRPFPPPPSVLVVPPQIITLPAPKASLRMGMRHAPASPAFSQRRKVVELRRRAPRLDMIAYRPFVWPVAYTCWPYAVAVVPIGFSPCDDPPHSAIDNTPCGVRPYE